MAKLIIEEFKIEGQTKWKALNLTAIEDPNLSPKAKFIHTYLVSRPPSWRIRIKDIINRSTVGRDSIYNGLKELVDHGYIEREQERDSHGRVKKCVYTIYIKPKNQPLPEKPDTAEQDTGNPEVLVYNSSNNNNHKTVSLETVIPDKSGLNEKPLLLRIKPRKKINNNGLLYDSSVAKRYKQVDLNTWNQHPLNKSSKYDPPVIVLQERIKSIKEPMVNETEEVVDHWNKNASQLSSNGHKLPSHRLDLDTKTSYMCKLIVTGILHTSNLTVEDIKKAIDNYRKVLENSHYYKHLYSFPQFYSKQIFSDCVEGNLSTYIKYKKKLTKEELLEIVKKEHKLASGYGTTYTDEQYYRGQISNGHIKTEDDARRYAQ